MKKLLLLLSVTVVAAGSVLATETENLIFTYDYTNWPSYDPTPCTSSTTQVPYDWADNISNYWSNDTGFTAVNGGQLTSSVTDASTIASSAVGQAMTLLNFGGNIGTVLCFNGGSSGLQDYLNNSYNTMFGGTYTTTNESGESVTVTVQSITSGSPTGWLNFFWSYPADGSHRVSQNGSSNWIRAKIYLNIFTSSSDNSSTAVFDGIDFYSNGSITSGSSTDVTSSDFADENGAWQPNYWMTYTTDGYAGEGGSYNMGLRIKFESGTLASYAIFIRKIELYYVTSDDSSDYLSTATTEVDKESYTYEFTSTDKNGQTTGITSVVSDEAAGYSVNGQEVTFDSAATIYSISGSAVAVAKAGETKTLSKGFYVARVGNKGIKFAVK